MAEIIAGALWDVAVGVVTHVPDSGGKTVFEAFGRIAGRRLPFSFHEETAYTVAHGASLAGQRAATLFKSHGLAKATNSVVDSLASGQVETVLDAAIRNPGLRIVIVNFL